MAIATAYVIFAILSSLLAGPVVDTTLGDTTGPGDILYSLEKIGESEWL